MDTRLLESFIAVVDHGSMAAAARRLGLTPAAIGQRIRLLESEIEARLLVRSGRTVATTEAGLAFLDRARSVVEDIRDLKAIGTDDSLSGELRLGALPSATCGFLPVALKRMTQKHPRVAISIVPGVGPDLYSRV